MKLKNVAIAATALALAVGMTACGSSSSTAASSSVASSAAASGEGLADGDSVVITRDVEADKQADVTYVLEFTTEDGQTQAFETLHYETTPISLKSVDAAAGATPIAFAAPEN